MEIIRGPRAAPPSYAADGIALLTITRGRPHAVRQLRESLLASAARPDRLEHWLYIDDDDPTATELIGGLTAGESAIPVTIVVAPRPATLHDAQNEIAPRLLESSGLLLSVPDDYALTTPGWDDTIRAVFADHADRLVVPYASDPHHAPEQLILFAVSREWVETVGYFLAPYFPFWYSDNWMNQQAVLIGRKIAVDLGIKTPGGRGKSQRAWNVPFWNRFFEATAPQRVDEALRLFAARHDTTEADLARFRGQRDEMIRRCRVDLNPQHMPAMAAVRTELAMTAESTAIPQFYLDTEMRALAHLRHTGQDDRRPAPVPARVFDGPSSVAERHAVVRALVEGASFAEVGAMTPAQASLAMEWRNLYAAGFFDGWKHRIRVAEGGV